jgi:serine O-acetyltransferase
MPDPVAHAIHLLLDHMNAVESKIDRMCDSLTEQGIRSCDEELPKLKDEDFEAVRGEEDE